MACAAEKNGKDAVAWLARGEGRLQPRSDPFELVSMVNQMVG